MASDVDICNLALGRIGHTDTIASLGENSKAGEVMGRLFPLCLEFMLRDYYWNFTHRAKTLALVTGAEFPGWEYVYRFPSDALAIRQVTTEAGSRYRWVQNERFWNHPILKWSPPEVPFDISSDSSGRLILTDLADAYVVYTANITDVALTDSLFIDAFAWRLAAESAMPLAVDERKALRAQQQLGLALTRAQGANANEQEPDEPPESPAISARW